MKKCIILLHGFGGTPYEMYELGDFLKKKGFYPEYPLLPGHRDKPESLIGITKEDWVDYLLNFYEEMSKKYDKIYLCGLSMGALLSGIIAVTKKPEKLTLLSPAVYVKKASFSLAPIGLIVKKKLVRICDFSLNPESYHFAPTFSVYQLWRTRNEFVQIINLIESPTLIVHGTNDEIIKPLSSIFINSKLQTKKELKFIDGATHVLTLDNKRNEVFNLVYEWIK